MSDTVETIELDSGYKIEIWYSYHHESPRDWENLGTYQIYHRRYASPDRIERDPPVIKKNEIGLKVWGYDHGNVIYETGETNPFHCPWDSGFAGIIFTSLDRVRQFYGVKRVTAAVRQKVIEQLKWEVKIYNEYINGEVYGYTTYDPAGEELDSCGGYYGSDREYMLESAKECIPNDAR